MLATEFFNPSPAQYTRFPAIFRSNPLILRDIPEFHRFRGVRSPGCSPPRSPRCSPGCSPGFSGGFSGRLSPGLSGGLSGGLSTGLSGGFRGELPRGLRGGLPRGCSTGRSPGGWGGRPTPLSEDRLPLSAFWVFVWISDFVLVSSFGFRCFCLSPDCTIIPGRRAPAKTGSISLAV